MPSRAWPLWLLTTLILVAFPVTNFIYWVEVLRSGVLPPDGDSIMIPIVGGVCATLLASPLVMGAAIFCLRRYNSEACLMAWRKDRPYRSAILTLFLGGLALTIAVGLIADIKLELPWYEHLWTAYLILLILWLLGLRAAAIEQLNPPEKREA